MSDTKYCQSCGQQLQANARYCDRCGDEQPPPQQAQQQPAPQQADESSNTRTVAVVVAVIIGLVLGVGILSLLGGGGSADTPAQTTQSQPADPPDAVVDDYWAAVDSGDTETMEQLTQGQKFNDTGERIQIEQLAEDATVTVEETEITSESDNQATVDVWVELADARQELVYRYRHLVVQQNGKWRLSATTEQELVSQG